MDFVKITEQPSLYDDLEKKSVLELLQEINAEDQREREQADDQNI